MYGAVREPLATAVLRGPCAGIVSLISEYAASSRKSRAPRDRAYRYNRTFRLSERPEGPEGSASSDAMGPRRPSLQQLANELGHHAWVDRWARVRVDSPDTNRAPRALSTHKPAAISKPAKRACSLSCGEVPKAEAGPLRRARSVALACTWHVGHP